MNKEDLVSVILTTYNRADLLAYAVDSVLAQTYQNIELIIVDDCSQDNTREIVDNYLIKDKRVSFIGNEKNMGVSYSRNVGIKRSRGAFLMFLDDDCQYLPGKIEDEIGLMYSLSPQPSMIYSNMWSEEEGSKPIYPLDKKDRFITKKDIMSRKYIILGTPSWFCKSEAVKKLNGFDTELYKFVDLDLSLRMIFNGERLYFFNKPSVIVRFVKGISELTLKSVIYREMLLKKHLPNIKSYKNFISFLYWRIAYDSVRLGYRKKAQQYCWKAFISHPLKVEYLFKTVSFAFKKPDTAA